MLEYYGQLSEVSLTDLFLNYCRLSAEEIYQTESVLKTTIGESKHTWKLNAHLLPKEVIFRKGKSPVKKLGVSWQPVFGDSETVERVILILKDVTELKKLEVLAERKQKEGAVITEIVGVKPETFESMLGDCLIRLDENRNLLMSTKNPEPKDLNLMYRNLHTMKGNSRLYGFSFLTDAVHRTEEKLLEVQSISKWDKKVKKFILEKHLDINKEVQTYEDVYRQRLSKYQVSQGAGGRLTREIRSFISQKGDQEDPENLSKFAKKILSIFSSESGGSVNSVLSQILPGINSMARKLDKNEPVISVTGGELELAGNIHNVVKNFLIQCMQNSVDHGIEPSEVRRRAGKSESGKIQLEVQQNGPVLRMIIFDDGEGLKLGKIRQKIAETTGESLTLEDSDLAASIFHHGFSTRDKDEVTIYSGRGVGLDIVKRDVQRMGGSVHVRLKSEQKLSKGCPFEIVVEIPNHIQVA